MAGRTYVLADTCHCVCSVLYDGHRRYPFIVCTADDLSDSEVSVLLEALNDAGCRGCNYCESGGEWSSCPLNCWVASEETLQEEGGRLVRALAEWDRWRNSPDTVPDTGPLRRWQEMTELAEAAKEQIRRLRSEGRTLQATGEQRKSLGSIVSFDPLEEVSSPDPDTGERQTFFFFVSFEAIVFIGDGPDGPFVVGQCENLTLLEAESIVKALSLHFDQEYRGVWATFSAESESELRAEPGRLLFVEREARKVRALKGGDLVRHAAEALLEYSQALRAPGPLVPSPANTKAANPAPTASPASAVVETPAPECGEPAEPAEAAALAKGTSKDEANVRARAYLAEHAKNHRVTKRELAAGIRCSEGLVSKLPAWKAYQEKLRKTEPPAPRAVQLTDGVLANEGRDDEELQRLIGEQAEDAAADARGRRRRPMV